MDKYLKMWEPVLRNFEGNYEAMRLEQKATTIESVVDWCPSGYMEITAKMSNGKSYIYDFINNKIIPIYKQSDLTALRNEVCTNEEAWRKNFSERFKKRMDKKGISQDRLSEMTGISRITINKYVNALVSPSGYNLTRLGMALGCSVSELVSVY